MKAIQKGGTIVLLPCNGLSARGRLTHEAAVLIQEGLREVQRIDLVPLMAELPEEIASIRQAGFVMGLAGCEYRCDLNACQKSLGRAPDDFFLIGDLVRKEVYEYFELSEEERKAYALEVSSQVLKRLSRL